MVQTNDGAVTGLNTIAIYDTVNKTWSPLPHQGLRDPGTNAKVLAIEILYSTVYLGGRFSQTQDDAITGFGNIARLGDLTAP